MNLKLNFQISIPVLLDKYGGNTSWIDIKPHFMTQDFYLSINVLDPTENIWKYNAVSFDLSNENMKNGSYSLDLDEDITLFTVYAEFNLKPRSKYSTLVNNVESKWAFGGIFISKEILSIDHDLSFSGSMENGDLWNAELVYGGRLEEFRYMKRDRPFHEKYFLLNTHIV